MDADESHVAKIPWCFVGMVRGLRGGLLRFRVLGLGPYRPESGSWVAVFDRWCETHTRDIKGEAKREKTV